MVTTGYGSAEASGDAWASRGRFLARPGYYVLDKTTVLLEHQTWTQFLTMLDGLEGT